MLGRETVEEYTREISRVCEEIFEKLSVLMGMKEEGLKELHQDMKLAMRMNYYPPCPKPDLVLGISPHSDGGSITILLQDDHVTALQIHHHGHWIPVKPLPSAFVVNVGDALEVPTISIHTVCVWMEREFEEKSRRKQIFPCLVYEFGEKEKWRPKCYFYLHFFLEKNGIFQNCPLSLTYSIF